MNLDARKAIQAYLEVRPEVADDHLFIGQRGEGLKEQAVENVIKKYARLADLPQVTPHTFRHTFARELLDKGENLVTVSRMLGHESLETTAIYTTPTALDFERAARKLERDQELH